MDTCSLGYSTWNYMEARKPRSPSLLILPLGQGSVNTEKFLFFGFLFFQAFLSSLDMRYLIRFQISDMTV